MQLGEVYRAKYNSAFFIYISRWARGIDDGFLIIADEIMDIKTFMTSPAIAMYFKSEEELLENFNLYMTSEEANAYLKILEEGRKKVCLR